MTRFSVIINTFDRKEELYKCLERLENQDYEDFEVIIVNQGKEDIAHERFKVIESKDRGPAYGRNRGAEISEGEILAFTDDDCLPRKDWLKKADRYFEEDISGLEGNIITEKGPKNNGESKLHGFATANMFYTKEIFEKVGGFDERIGVPPYREDTDLAWRVMEEGKIKYAEDVIIDHPPKDKEKNWRVHQYDVLLYKKHPQKFKEFNKNLPIREIPKSVSGWIKGMFKFNQFFPVLNFILDRLRRRFYGK